MKVKTGQCGPGDAGAVERGAEEWRDVNTHGGVFAGRYQVSNRGRVRTNPDGSFQGSPPGRVLFQGTDNRGYKHVELVGLDLGRGRTTIKVHRLVACAFIGPRPDGLTVNHIDGDKKNNRLENLEYITNRENARHAVVKVRGGGVEIDGERMTLAESVELYGGVGVTFSRAYARIHRHGWRVEDAVRIPAQRTGRPSRAEIEARKAFA